MQQNIMHVDGLPQTFWVVTKPSPRSTLGDVCFETDFDKYAKQVRGGLHEHDVAGVFADEQAAKAFAKSLLHGTTDKYIYYVGTLGRYVLVEASNARGALEAGEQHPDLDGSEILTVRIATKGEIEQAGWHGERPDHEDTCDFRHHTPPWDVDEYIVSQDGSRGVSCCHKLTGQLIKYEPPAEWGTHWRWNLSEIGTGIDFYKTK